MTVKPIDTRNGKTICSIIIEHMKASFRIPVINMYLKILDLHAAMIPVAFYISTIYCCILIA